MPPPFSETVLPIRIEDAVSGSGVVTTPLGITKLAGDDDQSRPVHPDPETRCCDVSVIIPSRNEASWIVGTLHATRLAVEHARELDIEVELIVVDNQSTDGTWESLQQYQTEYSIRPLRLLELGAARARNFGRSNAKGRILIFVDADTHLPHDGIARITHLCDEAGMEAGITRLAALDGGWQARVWWTFWEHVRRLPFPKAKAMPAVMFCTTAVFDEFGPFDEEVAIGEEWPILASVYRCRPRQFVYDRSLTAYTSSRRMERQTLGYLRTFLKYVWAILHKSGRIHYTDRLR